MLPVSHVAELAAFWKPQIRLQIDARQFAELPEELQRELLQLMPSSQERAEGAQAGTSVAVLEGQAGHAATAAALQDRTGGAQTGSSGERLEGQAGYVAPIAAGKDLVPDSKASDAAPDPTPAGIGSQPGALLEAAQAAGVEPVAPSAQHTGGSVPRAAERPDTAATAGRPPMMTPNTSFAAKLANLREQVGDSAPLEGHGRLDQSEPLWDTEAALAEAAELEKATPAAKTGSGPHNGHGTPLHNVSAPEPRLAGSSGSLTSPAHQLLSSVDEQQADFASGAAPRPRARNQWRPTLQGQHEQAHAAWDAAASSSCSSGPLLQGSADAASDVEAMQDEASADSPQPHLPEGRNKAAGTAAAGRWPPVPAVSSPGAIGWQTPASDSSSPGCLAADADVPLSAERGPQAAVELCATAAAAGTGAGLCIAAAGASAGALRGLPPVSQLDQSILEELPLQLRRELEFAYGEQLWRPQVGACWAAAQGGSWQLCTVSRAQLAAQLLGLHCPVEMGRSTACAISWEHCFAWVSSSVTDGPLELI